MRRSAVSLSALVLVGVCGGMVAPAVATAEAAVPASFPPIAGVFRGATASKAPAPSALAGYLPAVSRQRESVIGKVTVAAVTCGTSTGATYTIIGLGSSRGVGFVGGYLQSGCHNGTPFYRATVIGLNGVISSTLTVRAGDVLSVRAVAGTHPQATLTDVTAATSTTGTVAAFVADLAQVTVQADGSPFPTFTRYSFAGIKVSAVALPNTASTRVNQVSAAGRVQLAASAVSATGGFAVRYVSQG